MSAYTYRVERATTLLDPWEVVADGLTDLSVDLLAQPSNTSPWYQVIRVDQWSLLESPASDPIRIALVDPPEITAIGIDNYIAVDWAANSGCSTIFNVYRLIIETGAWQYISTVENATYYWDFTIRASKNYCYRVTAITEDGVESDPSNTACAQIEGGRQLARATQFQNIQAGLESTSGVVVPATMKWVNMGLTMKPQIPNKEVKYPGSKLATGMQIGQDMTEGRFTGVMDFNLVGAVLTSMFGTASPSTVATIGRSRVWTPDAVDPLNPKTWTIEQGSTARGAERLAYCLFNALTLRWSRENADIEGTLFGQRQARGITMTPNVKVHATSTAAIGATTIAVTALSGAIANGTTLLFTNGASATLSAGASGSDISLTVTSLAAAVTSGSWAATVPTLPGMDVDPISIGVWLSADGVTYSRLSKDIDGEIHMSGIWKPDFHVNESNNSFDDVVEDNPMFTAQFGMEDGVASGEVDNFVNDIYNGTNCWVGIKALGPLISGSTYHELKINMPCFVHTQDPQDKSSVWGNNITFVGRHDDFYGMSEITLVNKIVTQY